MNYTTLRQYIDLMTIVLDWGDNGEHQEIAYEYCSESGPHTTLKADATFKSVSRKAMRLEKRLTSFEKQVADDELGFVDPFDYAI